MRGISRALLSTIVLASVAGAWDIGLVWSRVLDAHGMSAAGLCDLDGDGAAEILAAGNRRLYCFDTAGTQRWSFEPMSNYFPSVSSPLAADINNDGTIEVVVASPAAVYTLKPETGDSIWRRVLDGQGAVQNCISSVALGDINGDSTLEVFCYEVYASRLLCLDPADGETLWTYVPGGSIRFGVGTATVADIDGDGEVEVLGQVTRYDGGILYCLDRDGQELWSYATSGSGLSGWQLASAAVADIDGDDSLEVLGVANYWGAFCLETDGSERWTFQRSEHAAAYPLFADIDGDDSLEALVVLGPTAHCLDARTGSQEWSFTVLTGYYIVSSPGVGDLDGDGRLETILAETKTSNPRDSLRPFWVLDADGNPIWHDTVGTALADPTVGDVDTDGRVDLVLGSTYRDFKLWLYEADTATVAPGVAQWPTLQHDIWRSGWFGYQGPAVGVQEQGRPAVRTRIVARPNPFAHAVRFSGLAAGCRELEIADAAGRVIDRVAVSDGAARWDGSGAAAGVYYAGPRGPGIRVRIIKLEAR